MTSRFVLPRCSIVSLCFADASPETRVAGRHHDRGPAGPEQRFFHKDPPVLEARPEYVETFVFFLYIFNGKFPVCLHILLGIRYLVPKPVIDYIESHNLYIETRPTDSNVSLGTIPVSPSPATEAPFVNGNAVVS